MRSAPRSLNLAVPRGLAEGQRNLATFRSGLLATNLHVVMELDWKLSFYSEMESGHTVQFASVFMNNSANAGIGYTWDGLASTGSWFVGRSAVDAGGALYPISRPPTSETRWTRVRFDVTFSNTGDGHLYVSFDGTEVVHEDNLTNAPATTGPQTMVASPIVWTLQGTTPQTDVFYDNVWFEVD